jgi:hypothetical protein
MRKLVLFGLFFAFAGAAPSVLACDGKGTQIVEVVLVAPTPLATQQSQALLADATKLDSKADTEEAASATVLISARSLRRRAASIRVQAGQVSEASQGALLGKADKLDAEAATHDAASATFLARAKIIRQRAKSLRALSTRVLASGAVSMQVLPRVALPAPPAGHPDAAALRMLDAAPRLPAATTTVVRSSLAHI